MNEKENGGSVPHAGYGVANVNIDGARIREIREEKGLTQLYLSEMVGVTTDTISRWENRRYPSIKLENARNLALALEVGLDEILEREDRQTEGEDPPAAVTEKRKISPRVRIGISLALIFILIVSVLIYRYFSPAGPPVTSVAARRLLPPHIPPGQVFPVLIFVSNPEELALALILKETIPPGTRIETGVPFFTTIDPGKNELKWISRTDSPTAVYAYLARAPGQDAEYQRLEFTGSVTLKQQSGSRVPITGDTSLEIAPYHWADTNQDAVIDDEEILAVYELYSDIDGLGYDRDLIDDIWAGSGYRWDPDKGVYSVVK
jgi:transcriptional regulator with XRE-family HTH domain